MTEACKRWRVASLTLIALALFWNIPAGAGDVFRGKEIYREYCSDCHGNDGRSDIGNAPDLSRGESLMQSDVSLMESISSGKGTMPGYRGMLSDQEILDVISYIRILF